MDQSPPEAPAPTAVPTCAICLCPAQPEESLVQCGSCSAIYHADCWQANGGCAIYGCPQVPPTEALTSVEVPTSYWGMEHKRCPACGSTILAAAMRCRHCGNTFDSARPEHPTEFSVRRERQKRLPATRKQVVWLFICSAIPFLAPFAAVFGLIWYVRHRTDLKALPTMYSALAKVALAVAMGQTAFGICVAMLWNAARSG
ncbi:MAG: hypothetical protein JW889_10730 [Verrucomicrobia bacterium]|nr:hypothetical protein [Verrucomicrobiota bacterium]